MGANGPGGGPSLDRNTSKQAAANVDYDYDAAMAEMDKEIAAKEAAEKADAAAAGANITLSRQLDQMFPGNKDMQFVTPSLGESFDYPLQTRDSFFSLMNEWQAGLPLQSLWACIFKIPDKVSTAAMYKWGEYVGADPGTTKNAKPKEGDFKGMGSVDAARYWLNINDQGFMHHKYQGGVLGCLLCQTVGIPVEQSAVSTVGPSNRGFIKGPIMETRQPFAPVNIEFLETNLSFLEFILRPWTVICQHEGLVARNWNQLPGVPDPAERVTTDMMIVNFGKTGSNAVGGGNSYYNQRGLVPRKIWFFQDCFPVNIGPERYSYTADTSPDRRDTEWNFRKYEAVLPAQYCQTMHEINIDDGGSGGPSKHAQTFWKEHKEIYKSSHKVKGGFFGLFG
jgi:hypothetical protein